MHVLNCPGNSLAAMSFFTTTPSALALAATSSRLDENQTHYSIRSPNNNILAALRSVYRVHFGPPGWIAKQYLNAVLYNIIR